MPRLPRIHIEGSIYLVTSKAPDEQVIFKEKADYEMYLELLTKYKSEHKFKLFSYCLLPDRLQLLIETGSDATISEIMHDLNSLYTKHFNGRYSRKGPLFESRFRSVLTEKASHLLQMTRLIHNASGDPKGHPYSSFHLYVAGRDASGKDAKSRGMADEIREVTGFLDRKDDPEAYARYCLQGDVKELEEFEKKLKRASVLGSDEFVERARTRIQEKADLQKETTRRSASRINPLFLFFIGGMVIVAAGSAVYLYITKADLEKKYEMLLREKETEFDEKTRFENLSPIALANLHGTEWRVELVARKGTASSITDVLRFGEKDLISDHFSKEGFGPAVFEVTKSGRRTIWQAMQKNAQGDRLVWRGDWRGDAMKGSVRLEPAFGESQSFSFFSVKWSYAEVSQ